LGFSACTSRWTSVRVRLWTLAKTPRSERESFGNTCSRRISSGKSFHIVTAGAARTSPRGMVRPREWSEPKCACVLQGGNGQRWVRTLTQAGGAEGVEKVGSSNVKTTPAQRVAQGNFKVACQKEQEAKARSRSVFEYKLLCAWTGPHLSILELLPDGVGDVLAGGAPQAPAPQVVA